MSISTTSFDEEDTFDALYSLDSYTNSTSSFTSWGYVQLLSSSLYAPNEPLKPVRDRGAISDSLQKGKVDLFDRTPKQYTIIQRILRLADLVGSFTFIHTVLAPIGAFYHTANCFKYTAQWIKLSFSKENTERAKQNLIEHAGSAMFDIVNGTIPLVALIAGTSTMGLLAGAAAATVATLAFFGKRMLYNDRLATDLAHKKDIYGLHKSILIKEQFGIVNEKTGGLLSWDSKKDNDITMSYSYYGNTYYLDGYFATLYEEQAVELLKAIQSLQTMLPSNCNIPFSYPPKAETIVAFLNKNREISGLSYAEINAWKEKLFAIEGNMQSMWKIISDGFSASNQEVRHEGNAIVYTTYVLSETFPLSEGSCRAYYK